jgi:hypothetical protein
MQCRLCTPDKENECVYRRVITCRGPYSLFAGIEFNDDILLHSFPLIFYGERIPSARIDSVEQNAPSAPLSLYRHK